MEDLKNVIAANVASLRRAASMTQLELAEKLNYSDKAVSKWERGESIPDVAILKAIADLFGVTVDYLLTEDHEEKAVPDSVPVPSPHVRRNRFLIAMLATALVWMSATAAFVALNIGAPEQPGWMAYIAALPVSCIVLLVFNSIWGLRKRNFLIISVLMWSLLLLVYLLLRSYHLWMLFLLGIPGQIGVLLWSGLRKP